jgi:hypothetical protein
MELLFCDLCQEAVPSSDAEQGLAFVKGDRVVCKVCNAAMGGPGGSAAQEGLASRGPASSVSTLPSARPARRPGLVSPGVAAALGVAAIVLTLFAVVALLVRLESISREWREEFSTVAEKVDDLSQRELGTRRFMVAEAGRVSEEVLRSELRRLETMERQLAELRASLMGDEARSGPESEESLAETKAGLLTAGDGLARVRELEEQILFLQARVFELTEGAPLRAEAVEQAAERPLPLPKTLAELVARLGDDDPVERVGALYALTKVSDPGVVSHVVPLLDDEDRYIRALAARTLERMEARSAVQSLLDALEDSDASVREAAVSALRAITGEQFGFDPLGPLADRRRAVARWQAWWGDHWKEFLYGED